MRPRLQNFTAAAALIGGLTFAVTPALAQDSEGFQAGIAAYEIGKYDEAIKTWEPLAEKGNVNALNMLAQVYRLGLGVQQDDTKAFELYDKAAERGSPEAQVNVAFQLLTGKGVDRSPETAATWFAKAADQGNALAQYNLGLMYEKGIGVDQDQEFAADLYRLAAGKGQKRAVARLEALEASVEQNPETAQAEAEAAEKAAAAAKAEAEEKASKLAEAEAEKKKAATSPILSIKKVDAADSDSSAPLEFEKLKEDGEEATPSYTSVAEESGAKTNRPIINVTRTPTRKPGQKVAGAPKGNEPSVINIPDDVKITYAPPPPAPPVIRKPVASSIATSTRRAPSDPIARIKMAETAYRNGSFDEATELLMPLSNAGMPAAQFWMGRLYNRGEGVVLNRSEAYSLWRSAAAAGSERAATALANLAARLSPEEISIAEQRHAESGRAR